MPNRMNDIILWIVCSILAIGLLWVIMPNRKAIPAEKKSWQGIYERKRTIIENTDQDGIKWKIHAEIQRYHSDKQRVYILFAYSDDGGHKYIAWFTNDGDFLGIGSLKFWNKWMSGRKPLNQAQAQLVWYMIENLCGGKEWEK